MGPITQPPPKPLSLVVRPDLTRLPKDTPGRRRVRRLFKGLAGLFLRLGTRVKVRGLEHFPLHGPALVVSNHLGDADVALALVYLPVVVDAFAKIELYHFPVLGRLMDSFGVIWVHRGQPDRNALQAALEGFRQGRLIGVAPEARESLTEGLEEGVGGAAYLAIKGKVRIIPVTFTGTENKRVFGNLKRFRKTAVTMTVGPAFGLQQTGDLRVDVRAGTGRIMLALARQLPPKYRGRYRDDLERVNGDS